MSDSISIIPRRYEKEVEDIVDKHAEEVAKICCITAMDAGDRRFLLKRCAMKFAQQVYGIRMDDQYRKELAERKAS